MSNDNNQTSTPSNEELSNLAEEVSSKKGNKKIGLSIGAILLLLGIIYGIGVYYYSSHFHHNIYINNKKVSEMTIGEAEKVFTNDIDSHTVVLEEKERKEAISAGDIDTKISVGNQITELQQSLSPWVWFTDLFGKKNFTVFLDVTFDEKKLETVVDQLQGFDNANITKPVDAYIKAGETQFEIVPEVLGNKIKKKALIKKVEECLATGENVINLEKEDLYVLPKYFAKDDLVKQALDKANKYTQGTITYDFKYTTETVDYKLSKNWIEISDDFKVTLNTSDVGDYVDSLCKKYNTMGSSRKFTTAYGEERNVYGGDYGWKIYFDKEKAKLIKEIKSGKDVSREPIYSYTAAVRTKDGDIGDSYVEVSIASQELWLVIDGKVIMNSSVVTGKPGYDTDTGVYGLTYKKSPETLRGYNGDGSSYASDVTYWMPFNGNQGLHDATWRNSFGGSIYKSNGSHGCVNCPYDVAATLYKYVDEGFPVIIY